MKENKTSENSNSDGISVNPVPSQTGKAEKKPKAGISKYIPWHELLRRTFKEEAKCPECSGKLKLIYLCNLSNELLAFFKEFLPK